MLFRSTEVIWDYAVLSQANGKTDVLVGIVRKSVLREHLAALSAADIDPRVVTLAPLALAGLGEKNLVSGALDPAAAPELPATGGRKPPEHPLTAVLLDAGPDRANLALLDDGRPVLARALATSGAQAWALAQTDEAARTRLLALLSRDLKISLRSKKVSPQKLLLAGAVASLPGAAEKLSAELPLPVESIALPAGAPGDALARGLALRAQHPRGRVNFRKGEFAFTKDLSQVRGQVSRLAVAAVVLLILGLGLGLARLASLHHQAKAYDEAVCAATKRILGTCTTDYRQALGQLSGGRSRAAGVPRVSAADVFAELVAHLPDASLPLLEDVELTTTSVRMKGTAESYGKVDDISAALKKNKCFGEIKSPRTELTPARKISFAFDFAYTCSGETPGGA